MSSSCQNANSFAGFRRQVEVGGEESRTKLGNKLLHRVTFITPALAAEFAIKPRRVAGPVSLMPRSALWSLCRVADCAASASSSLVFHYNIRASRGEHK